MDVNYGGIPSAEAIRHLREKLNITTQHWDEMLRDIHAKAFTVAGATKLALLMDLREAVQAAIDNGESIGQFRNRFDEIVAEHGWTYKGQYGWRTRVIYDTNLRTAHMAGKWEQFQRSKATRPYLMYQTAGDKRVRHEHANWDGVIRHMDDDFWQSHYPPNGWGCRCTVVSLSERDMARKGLAVSDPPALNPTERVNTRTGEVYGEVPEGIDVGWDYNVGSAWLSPEKSLGETLVSLPAALKAQFLNHLKPLVSRLNDRFKGFLNEQGSQQKMVIGYIDPRGLGELGLKTAAITLSRQQSAGLPEDLPAKVAAPMAVIQPDNQTYLIYVVDKVVDDFRVVLIDLASSEVIGNDLLSREVLMGEGYRVLNGQIE